jgi:hypothetical protein
MSKKRYDYLTLDEARRCAEIVRAYRDFIKLTAIDYDLHLDGRTNSIVPEDHQDLIAYCSERRHLDWISEAMRRSMSGLMTTRRIFGLREGPPVKDPLSIRSLLDSSMRSLSSAKAFIDIFDREEKYGPELSKLSEALSLMREVRSSPFFSEDLPENFEELIPELIEV